MTIETVDMPALELMEFVQKVYALIDLVVEIKDLDVPTMAALLDLRDACKSLDEAMGS